MSSKYPSFAYIATTGAGVAIGTGIDLGGVFRASDLAGTVIIKDSGTTILTMSADRNMYFANPIACTGPVTMTSSAGDSFVVLFRDK